MQSGLSGWNDRPVRQTILDFVASVSDAGSAGYVPPAERIAVFDHDGTLWCEQPMYVQMALLLGKLAAQASVDPALRAQQPWQAAYEQDADWFRDALTSHYQGDDRALQTLIAAVLPLSDGQRVEQIEAEATEFVFQEYHPLLKRPYAACTYQPMRELLRYLESHEFTIYLVSGSGRDFIRGFAQQLYGIPRERVIGSAAAYRYVEDAQGGAIVQRAAMDALADGAEKPVQIWSVAGRRPILAAGNANGDLPMLRFTGGPDLPALRLLIQHDDAEREFAYTAGAEQALVTAATAGWTIVSMRRDWNRVFGDDN